MPNTREEVERENKLMEPSKLLLTQASIDVVAFGASEESRYHFNAIHITNEYVQATDGHMLVRVTHPKMNADDYPETPGSGFEEAINCIIARGDLKSLKIPKKSPLPILQHVCLSQENGNILLTTGDLSAMQTLKIHPVDADYPETDQVIPEKGGLCFSVDAKLLKVICDYVAKQSPKDKPAQLTFYVTENDGCPIRFEFSVNGGDQQGMGVLMPLRK